MVVVGKGQGAGGVRRRKALGGAHVRITNYELRITIWRIRALRAGKRSGGEGMSEGDFMGTKEEKVKELKEFFRIM